MCLCVVSYYVLHNFERVLLLLYACKLCERVYGENIYVHNCPFVLPYY